ESLAATLVGSDDISLADAAFTLQLGRREFGERLAVIGRTRDEVVRALREQGADRFFRGSEAKRRPVAFLFPGVGEQYVNMAAGLYKELPAFRDEMDACLRVAKEELGLDLAEALFVDNYIPPSAERRFLRGEAQQDSHTEKLNRTLYAQSTT